jgi:hypothetical protein
LVTNAIEETVKSLGYSPVDGTLSHEVAQNMLDGNNAIPVSLNLNKYTIDKFNFEPNTVYAICVAVAETNEYSKAKDSSVKTNVYKRNYEGDFDTKTKAAKAFYKQVIDDYGYFAFAMNQFEESPVR